MPFRITLPQTKWRHAKPSKLQFTPFSLRIAHMVGVSKAFRGQSVSKLGWVFSNIYPDRYLPVPLAIKNEREKRQLPFQNSGDTVYPSRKGRGWIYRSWHLYSLSLRHLKCLFRFGDIFHLLLWRGGKWRSNEVSDMLLQVPVGCFFNTMGCRRKLVFFSLVFVLLGCFGFDWWGFIAIGLISFMWL